MPWKIKQYFVFNHKCGLVLFIGYYSSFLTLPPSCGLNVSLQKNSYVEALFQYIQMWLYLEIRDN